MIKFVVDSQLDPVAMYAAVVSTLVGIWQYTRWRNRYCLHIDCKANMLFVPSPIKQKYMMATVVNKGDQPTTITHFFLYYWDDKFSKIFKKEKRRL